MSKNKNKKNKKNNKNNKNKENNKNMEALMEIMMDKIMDLNISYSFAKAENDEYRKRYYRYKKQMGEIIKYFENNGLKIDNKLSELLKILE